ncbi:MAG: hypothetical protein IH985_02120 [Planctomycetes bacterium]|nr:hypothetical protein [Planctomycetota bacterium]
MHLEWSFRYRADGPGPAVLLCDLIDRVTRAVKLTHEGAGLTEELLLAAAIEIAETKFPAGQGDGADDAETEHEKLLAEKRNLQTQLAEQRALGAQA